jgi:3-oxoacyl-[acyl-carrier-protein] synthase II
MRRRVAITGIGTVTALGTGVDRLWEGVLQGVPATRKITRFDPSEFRSQVAAEVDRFDPLDFMDARRARRLDRFAQFGLASAWLAIWDAELCRRHLDPTRCGVAIGSALGGLAYAEEQHSLYLREGIGAIGPALAVAVYGGASGANIAIEHDFRGPHLSNSSSCASGTIAVGEAFRAVRSGEADVMLAGGVEAPLAPLTFGAFSRIKAMSTRNQDPASACRPFDSCRDGFVMGEGAAVLVLEERDGAIRRGAKIYAEVLGYGQSNDAFHMTAPRPGGEDAARAIGLALTDGRVSADEIAYVNAHATGTPLGDEAECSAIRLALGEHAGKVPVSSTKPLYGHPLGASGAIETAVTALAVRSNHIPGTPNLTSPDPACCVDTVGPSGRRGPIGRALTTSFGFGGVNAALVLGRDP